MTDSTELTPTIDLIQKHRSIRKYLPDPIPRTMIEAIVAASQRSSTSSNLQAYSVIAVIAEDKRKSLATLCGNQAFIAQAPVFLAWCADYSRLCRVCDLRGYTPITGYVENFLVAAVDAAIAMQTATIAAESLGLGMCYIGGIRNKPHEIKDLLELPDLVFPISGMTLGWPDEERALKPRLPLGAILHWEKYDRSNEDESLLNYDQRMVATGIYKGRQVPDPNKPYEMQNYGWLEHTARRTSRVIRAHLKQTLEEIGFELK
jgi:FMN reductase (NADPH)